MHNVGQGNRGDEKVMDAFGIQEIKMEGQMVLDSTKRMERAVANTFFRKRLEHGVTTRVEGEPRWRIKSCDIRC